MKLAKRIFLPAYSPDLNPIEQVFAKLCRYSAPPNDWRHEMRSARMKIFG
jgi:transposase